MNISLRRTLLLSLLSASVAFVGGCGDSSGDDSDTGGGADTGGNTDTGGGTDAGGSGDGSGSGGCDPVLASHQDASFRVISITISKPAGKGALLGGLMNTDFNADRLHILLDTQTFSSGCGDATFEITGNAGATTETAGTYTWYEGVEVAYKPATMSADGEFVNTESLDLIFPAVQPLTDPPIYLEIPVRQIDINGVIAESGDDLVLEGTLTGVILLEEAEQVELRLTPDAEPQTIAELLGTDEMDYPAGAAEFTGWQLEATIQAVRVTTDF